MKSRLFRDTVLLKRPSTLDRDRNTTYDSFIIRDVFLDGGSLTGQGQAGTTRAESASLYIHSRYSRMEELLVLKVPQNEILQGEELEEKSKNLPAFPQPSIRISIQEGDEIEKDGHTWIVEGINVDKSVTNNFIIIVASLK